MPLRVCQAFVPSVLPLISKKVVLPAIGAGPGQAPAPLQVIAALHSVEADILRSTCMDGVVGLHHVDFWLNICICHSLLVETADDGTVRYQGPSPDEVALVETAKQLGFIFKSRDSDSVHLEFQVRAVGSPPLRGPFEFRRTDILCLKTCSFPSTFEHYSVLIFTYCSFPLLLQYPAIIPRRCFFGTPELFL